MINPRLQDREILIAAIKEQLALADEQKNPEIRKGFVLEATRLGLRLLDLQKELGFEDD